jgi:hypothetical protein
MIDEYHSSYKEVDLTSKPERKIFFNESGDWVADD